MFEGEFGTAPTPELGETGWGDLAFCGDGMTKCSINLPCFTS